MKPFLTERDRRFLTAVSKVSYANPFLTERIEAEREALGKEFDETYAHWNLRGDDPAFLQKNAETITRKAESLLETLRNRLTKSIRASEEELRLYEDAVLFVLYYRYAPRFLTMIEAPEPETSCPFYREFSDRWSYYMAEIGGSRTSAGETAHVFAIFYQVRRAFYHIFRSIIGRSRVAAELRAAVWRSVFTHNFRRYRRTLYRTLGDFATLITGPTGSGKELVARAVGLSRYIPFHPGSQTFATDSSGLFFPINLSALPSTLVESELFGHRKGAYTGALEDRKGWLALCPPEGAVFLDEIGDLDPLIQVKLLRVLQDRVFQPLGSSADVRFTGKIIAATHRDPHEALREGRLRQDLYYRLCSDVIETPSLASQVAESPEVLKELVRFIARRIAGEVSGELVEETLHWIETSMGYGYPWPGNIRELEQCVRNIVIRREYHPVVQPYSGLPEDLWKRIREGSASLEEVICGVCGAAYARLGSYQAAARSLGVDRRTVKKYVDGE